MAIEVKEQYSSGEYVETVDSATLTRIFVVEGTSGELRDEEGPRNAASAPGIPRKDSVVRVRGRVLRVSTIRSERYTTDSCKVEVVYEWRKSAESSAGQSRTAILDRVYDWGLEINSRDTETYLDIYGRPIGWLGETVRIENPIGVYTFKVHTFYRRQFSIYVGRYNTTPFPLPLRYFDARTLLYLGASGSTSNVEVRRPGSDEPLEGTLNLTFKFSIDWEGKWPYYYAYPKIEIAQTKIGNKWGYKYWDPFKASWQVPDEFFFKAESPLVLEQVYGGRKYYLPPFIAEIRRGVDFNTVFNFQF